MGFDGTTIFFGLLEATELFRLSVILKHLNLPYIGGTLLQGLALSFAGKAR
jgi:hypothetical protein